MDARREVDVTLVFYRWSVSPVSATDLTRAQKTFLRRLGEARAVAAASATKATAAFASLQRARRSVARRVLFSWQFQGHVTLVTFFYFWKAYGADGCTLTPPPDKLRRNPSLAQPPRRLHNRRAGRTAQAPKRRGGLLFLARAGFGAPLEANRREIGRICARPQRSDSSGREGGDCGVCSSAPSRADVSRLVAGDCWRQGSGHEAKRSEANSP